MYFVKAKYFSTYTTLEHMHGGLVMTSFRLCEEHEDLICKHYFIDHCLMKVLAASDSKHYFLLPTSVTRHSLNLSSQSKENQNIFEAASLTEKIIRNDSW